MNWTEARDRFPETWLLIEAIAASTSGHQREVDEMAVIDTFDDSSVAMRHYLELHAIAPERELYVVHSSRPSLDIAERTWLGIRKAA